MPSTGWTLEMERAAQGGQDPALLGSPSSEGDDEQKSR